MGSPEHAYKTMLRKILIQFIRASNEPKDLKFIHEFDACGLSVEGLETSIKEAYPYHPAYTLFMAGVAMQYWAEHENIDQLNAGAGMIEKVYELLGIIEPEEKEEEI